MSRRGRGRAGSNEEQNLLKRALLNSMSKVNKTVEGETLGETHRLAELRQARKLAELSKLSQTAQRAPAAAPAAPAWLANNGSSKEENSKEEQEDLRRRLDGQLIEAVKEGDYSTVKVLVNNKDDASLIVNKNNTSLLHLAAHKGNQRVVQLLIDKGAKSTTNKKNQTPLYFAAKQGDNGVINRLLKADRDPQGLLDIRANGMVSGQGEAPLWAAAVKGHTHVVRNLLLQGATTNYFDSFQESIFTKSVRQGQHRFMPDYIESGKASRRKESTTCISQQMQKINQERGALFRAAKGGSQAKFDKLCSVGLLGIDAKDKDGATPLYLAAKAGKKDMVDHLLAGGADLNEAIQYAGKCAGDDAGSKDAETNEAIIESLFEAKIKQQENSEGYVELPSQSESEASEREAQSESKAQSEREAQSESKAQSERDTPREQAQGWRSESSTPNEPETPSERGQSWRQYEPAVSAGSNTASADNGAMVGSDAGSDASASSSGGGCSM